MINMITHLTREDNGNNYGGPAMSLKAVEYPCVTGASGEYMALSLPANAAIKGNNYHNWKSLSYDFLAPACFLNPDEVN